MTNPKCRTCKNFRIFVRANEVLDKTQGYCTIADDSKEIVYASSSCDQHTAKTHNPVSMKKVAINYDGICLSCGGDLLNNSYINEIGGMSCSKCKIAKYPSGTKERAKYLELLK